MRAEIYEDDKHNCLKKAFVVEYYSLMQLYIK